MQKIMISMLEMMNSSCPYDVHMERSRGRRIIDSGVWKTFVLRKEFGKEIEAMSVENFVQVA